MLDEESVSAAIEGAHAVYHFAGVADLDEAKTDPLETVRQNVLGTTVILTACRKKEVKRFLFASSIYVYSKAGPFYRSSKHAAELILEDFQKEYGIDFTIMRYGSLYGPRAGSSNWIRAMLTQALAENKITRKGDGNEMRDYIHVRDAARISVDALDDRYRNQYVIITGNQTIKVKDLLVMVREMLGEKVAIEYVPASKDAHYEITPYSFNPRVAKRIQSGSYLDLGQGLLDMLERIHQQVITENKETKENTEKDTLHA